MVNLEKLIESNYQDLCVLNSLSDISSDKIDYIKLAVKVPYKLLVKDLEFYDNFGKTFWYDKLKVINDLKIKYHVSELEIVERIKQIRMIQQFHISRENEKVMKKKKRHVVKIINFIDGK